MTKSNVEYADYQITVYPPPCPYQCRYCFWNTPLMKKRAEYIAKKFSFEKRLMEARRLKKKTGTVVISFTTDPYPPRELEEKRTRRILRELVDAKDLRVMVLTKNPSLAMRDLDLFVEGGFWLGTTVTCLSDSWRVLEPNVPSPRVRLGMLSYAYSRDINTWLSVEPIHKYTEVLDIVRSTLDFVDLYVFGSLNYAERLGLGWLRPNPDYYSRIMKKVLPLLEERDKQYVVKKELRRILKNTVFPG